MIDVNWDLVPDWAEEARFDKTDNALYFLSGEKVIYPDGTVMNNLLGQEPWGELVATRPKPAKKTVEDAVEYLDGNDWHGNEYNAIAYNPSTQHFAQYKLESRLNEKWHHVCTREQYEAAKAVKEEGEKWGGVGLPPVGTECLLAENTSFTSLQTESMTSIEEGARVVVTGHSKRPDNGAFNVVLMVKGNLDVGSCVGNHDFLCKPIKPTITKAEAWDMVSSENIERAVSVGGVKETYDITD